MKRFLSILMIAAVALLMFGCSKSDDKQSSDTSSASAAEAETRPFGKTAEPEWAPVDCEISLYSGNLVYAQNADFPTFAIVGDSDVNCALLFTVDKTAAAVLSMNQDEGIKYALSVNGDELTGTVSFNDDFTEMTFKGAYSYEDMCSIASVIRGL